MRCANQISAVMCCLDGNTRSQRGILCVDPPRCLCGWNLIHQARSHPWVMRGVNASDVRTRKKNAERSNTL